MDRGIMSDNEPVDLFISYTGVDQAWAEWIAWELEGAGYSVILQAWDFVSGSSFVSDMHKATQASARTIAVLSQTYLSSPIASAEWQAAWLNDPQGEKRKLLVFRVEPCERPGLLGQVVSDDLFDMDEEQASARLLQAIRLERKKPTTAPSFPGSELSPEFPGRLVSGTLEGASKAGGPFEFSNPWAVAFYWWRAVLNLDNGSLQRVVTPESRDNWGDLRDLKTRTEGSGLTTGVIKPVYDVAYVRLMDNAPQSGGPHRVEGYGIEVDAMVITLVLREELGGWRVHSVGYPADMDELPRTWV